MPRRTSLLAHVILVTASVLFLLPVVWMVSTSFKPERDVLDEEVRWIPETPTAGNYAEVLGSVREIPFFRWLANSLIVSVTGTLMVLVVASMAAYAFARIRFPGREKLFFLILTTIMIPVQVLLVPTYYIFQSLHLLNTYSALIIPAVSSVFGVFLLRQFLLSIPRDLEDAAEIDGCSRFQIWVLVILPLSRPALLTLATFTFLGYWNDFFWPLIATNTNSMRTLATGLAIFQGHYAYKYGLLMAASTLTLLPALVLFAVFQRYIIRGILMTGLKDA